MAQSEPRRSTRSSKTKRQPEFLYDMEEIQDFHLPTESLDSATHHSASLRPPRAAVEPSPSNKTETEKRIILARLETEKLQIEFQVLQLRQQQQQHQQLRPTTSVSETNPRATNKKKRQVDWPHDHIPGMSNNSEETTLEMPEFFAGFLAMIKTYDIKTKASMLLYLELLATKAISYSWPSVRAFHSNVSKQVELSRLDWSDTSAIRERASIFFRHSDLKTSKSEKPAQANYHNNYAAPKNNTKHQEQDKACKKWNYEATCGCDKSAPSYAALHVCRVCKQSHPMLHCSKRRQAIPIT